MAGIWLKGHLAVDVLMQDLTLILNRLYSTLLSAIAQKKQVRFIWDDPVSPSPCLLNSIEVKWDS